MRCVRCNDPIQKQGFKVPGYIEDYIVCELCTIDLRIGVDLWVENYEKDYHRFPRGAEAEGLDIGRDLPTIGPQRGGSE